MAYDLKRFCVNGLSRNEYWYDAWSCLWLLVDTSWRNVSVIDTDGKQTEFLEQYSISTKIELKFWSFDAELVNLSFTLDSLKNGHNQDLATTKDWKIFLRKQRIFGLHSVYEARDKDELCKMKTSDWVK